jgi:cell division septation protein DedD
MKNAIIFMLLWLFYQQGFAQNIYIDKPVSAGGLTLFPEISNANNYYFLPNKIRLGVGSDGSPQFSFLMFVKNLRGEENEAAPRQGDGGGVVHSVVELYVSDEEKKDAERELKRLTRNDAATILGPVIYKGGTMSLISSIADPAGGYSKLVLGLGPAPVLAGNKAAVSILLNKEGAKILWETFKTPTPDMSFSFVMDVEGFRSPISAWIDVNFDKVYESRTLDAGLKYRSGNGGQKQTPAARPAATTPAATTPAATTPAATTPAATTPATTTPAATTPAKTPSTTTPPKSGGGNLSILEFTDENPFINGKSTLLLTSSSILALNPFIRELKESFKEMIVPENNEVIVLDKSGEVSTYEVGEGERGEAGVYLDAEVQLMFEEMRQTGSIQVGGPQGDEKFEEIIKICYTKMLDMLFEPAGNNQSPTDMAAMMNAANQLNRQGGGNSKSDSLFDANGGVKLSVAYKFKQVRKTGKFRMDLNRSMTDALKIRFDENLGKIKCPACFRQINLDDAMFRQREIQVSVDGMNSAQFKKYVNYVAVSMKKTHGNGEITSDEVRVGVNEMEKTGNLFRLMYGWKDEKDAQKDKWLQYEYKETWSFFGDQTIESPWKNTDNFAINVGPPLQPYAVDIEASADLLKKQEVRSVNVKFYYNTGTSERMEQVNIRADGGNTATRVEFVLPDGKYEYEYEITWRLAGNKEVKTPRTKSSSSLLYVDEVTK